VALALKSMAMETLLKVLSIPKTYGIGAGKSRITGRPIFLAYGAPGRDSRGSSVLEVMV